MSFPPHVNMQVPSVLRRHDELEPSVYIGAWHSLGGLAQRGSGSQGLSHGPAWCGAEVTLHVLGDGLERVLLRGRLEQCVVVLGHLA